VDRNYKDGVLQGVGFPAGDRMCIESDQFAKPVRITRLPAAPANGDAQPQVTQLDYDDAEQLVQAISDPEGASPAGTKYVRDKWERVVAKGEQVTPAHTNWTCYAYADTNASETPRSENSQPQSGNRSTQTVLIPTYSADGKTANVMNRIHWSGGLFQPSGCTLAMQAAKPGKYGSRDIIPTHVERPDGSVILQTQLSSAGPGDVVIDSTGADPLKKYVTYDDFGRVNDAGRIDRGNGRSKKGSSLHASYDTADQLSYTATEDPNTGALVKINYEYDNSHHLTRVVGPTFAREYTVDAVGNVQSIADTPNDSTPPKGGIPGRPFGKPLGVSGPARFRSSCFQYDVHGRLLETVYPEGNAERYVYNPSGQLKEVWRGFEDHPLPWAANCNPTIQPNKPSSMHLLAKYGYDIRGRLNLIHEGAPVGFDTYVVPDGFGRIVDVITPLDSVVINGAGFYTQARHVVSGYDVFGRIAWRAVWGPSSFSYQKPTGLDPSLHTMTEFQYDLLGRLTQIDRWCFTEKPMQACGTGLHAVTTIEYDDAHDKVTTTDPEGKKSLVQLDGARRPKLVIAAQGAAVEQDVIYEYSQGGDTVTVTSSPAPAKTGQLVRTYGYNPHGALVTISEANRTLFSQTYDALGQPDKQIKLGMGEVQTKFDAYGRLYSVRQRTDSLKVALTVYEQDGNDRLTRIIDPEWHTTTMSYNELDEVASLTNGIGTTTYGYTAGTRLATIDDPAKTHHAFGYNRAGKLESEDVVDGPSLGTQAAETVRRFTYTTAGQVYQGIVQGDCRVPSTVDTGSTGQPRGAAIILFPCKNPDLVVTRDYDSLGRVVSEVNSALPLGFGHRFSLGKTDTDLIQAQAVVGTISTSYDDLYRPKQVTLNNQLIASMAYDKGALQNITHSNQLKDVLSFDDRGRMTGLDVLGNGAAIASLHDGLGFDDIPRERQRAFGQFPSTTDLFKSDQAGRLIAENLQLTGLALDNGDLTNEGNVDKHWDAQKPWSTYSLDNVGNWTSRTASGNIFTSLSNIAIDGANRYTQIDSGNGPNQLSYDGAGNLAAYADQKYTFNGLRNLLSASIGAAKKDFKYDAFGRRIEETDGVTTTSFIWDGQQLAAFLPKGHPEQARIRVGMGLDATLALAENLGAGPIYTLHAGPDGSTLAATDAQGTLIEGYRYTSQGDTVFIDQQQESSTSKIGNRVLFQGQLYDPTLRLYSMRAREYKPGWGRFLSPDPIGLAGGTNLYGFVGGATLTHSDPSGLSEKQHTETSGRQPASKSWEPWPYVVEPYPNFMTRDKHYAYVTPDNTTYILSDPLWERSVKWFGNWLDETRDWRRAHHGVGSLEVTGGGRVFGPLGITMQGRTEMSLCAGMCIEGGVVPPLVLNVGLTKEGPEDPDFGLAGGAGFGKPGVGGWEGEGRYSFMTGSGHFESEVSGGPFGYNWQSDINPNTGEIREESYGKVSRDFVENDVYSDYLKPPGQISEKPSLFFGKFTLRWCFQNPLCGDLSSALTGPR
jgi:RHS repeat-associated protein